MGMQCQPFFSRFGSFLVKSLVRKNDQGQAVRSDADRTGMVRHLARGNVSLQYGWFQTEEDVKNLRQELANQEFQVKGC